MIYAYGTATDRRLGIPGEDLAGSHSATEFVAWYNAHPDFADHEFDLCHERAVVIGNGNVAADVARMLALTREELEETDTADHAIEALAELRRSRRSSCSAAAARPRPRSPIPEVRELGEMVDADIIVDPDDCELDEISREHIESEEADPTSAPQRRDLHRLRRARAGGQAAPDRAALPQLADRDSRATASSRAS